MLLGEFLDRQETRTVDVDDLPPNIAERSGITNRLVLERIPPVSTCGFVSYTIILAPNIIVMGHRWALEIHIDQDAISKTYESPGVDVAIHFRILGESSKYDMLTRKLCSIPVKPSRKKYGDVVAPRISRSSAEQDPSVSFRNSQKRLDPCTITDHPLLVKYEERVLHIYVLFDVVPGVDYDLVLLELVFFSVGRHREPCKLAFPFEGVALPCGRDDVQVANLLSAVLQEICD